MCFPNLGVRVLGNTPAFACAYYVNACRRAPQRRVRGKELCSCDKSVATRLLQLLWIRLAPVSQQPPSHHMQSTLEAHIHTCTRAHTCVAQVHVQHHPSTAGGTCWPIHDPPTHTPLYHPLPPLTRCACVCVSRVLCASTRASAWFVKLTPGQPQNTIVGQCGACLVHARDPR